MRFLTTLGESFQCGELKFGFVGDSLTVVGESCQSWVKVLTYFGVTLSTGVQCMWEFSLVYMYDD